jgi:hypothetical protein
VIELVRNQPPGTTVRVHSINRYAQVVARQGRKHVVKYLNGTTGVVYASDITPIRKKRTYA